MMAGGVSRAFTTFWIGVVDLAAAGAGKAAARPVVGSSSSREVTADRVGWGRATGSAMDEDECAMVAQAWKALLRGTSWSMTSSA